MIEFALLGLRSLILINGGALVGLVTFLGHFAETGRPAAPLVASYVAFVAGLTAAFIAVLFSYLAQQHYSWDEEQRAQAAFIEGAGQSPGTLRASASADRDKGIHRQIVAIGFAVFSMVAFCAGCLIAVQTLTL